MLQCDLCRREVGGVADYHALRDREKFEDVKSVCGDCLNDLNEAMRRVDDCVAELRDRGRARAKRSIWHRFRKLAAPAAEED